METAPFIANLRSWPPSVTLSIVDTGRSNALPEFVDFADMSVFEFRVIGGIGSLRFAVQVYVDEMLALVASLSDYVGLKSNLVEWCPWDKRVAMKIHSNDGEDVLTATARVAFSMFSPTNIEATFKEDAAYSFEVSREEMTQFRDDLRKLIHPYRHTELNDDIS